MAPIPLIGDGPARVHDSEVGRAAVLLLAFGADFNSPFIGALGPHSNFPANKRPPHHVPSILLGAGLLWFGWFEFNGASMLPAGYPFLTTTFSASTALLTWCLIEW